MDSDQGARRGRKRTRLVIAVTAALALTAFAIVVGYSLAGPLLDQLRSVGTPASAPSPLPGLEAIPSTTGPAVPSVPGTTHPLPPGHPAIPGIPETTAQPLPPGHPTVPGLPPPTPNLPPGHPPIFDTKPRPGTPYFDPGVGELVYYA